MDEFGQKFNDINGGALENELAKIVLRYNNETKPREVVHPEHHELSNGHVSEHNIVDASNGNIKSEKFESPAHHDEESKKHTPPPASHHPPQSEGRMEAKFEGDLDFDGSIRQQAHSQAHQVIEVFAHES